MSDKVSAEAYVVLKPDVRSYGTQTWVYGIRADRMMKNKPKLNPGEIVVKVRLVFDKSQLIDSIPVVEMNVNNFTVAQPTPAAQVIEAEQEYAE